MTTMKAFSLLILLPIIVHAAKLTVDISVREIGRYSREPLRVIFSEPMIPLGFPPDSVPRGPAIRPYLPGKWQWGSQSTLLFTPDSQWREGTVFTATVPAGIKSVISGNYLKRPFFKDFSFGTFSVRLVNPRDLRSTVDFVTLQFSLRVLPDSLRNHLSGAPEPVEVSTSDLLCYRIRPPEGWPGGRRITLSIDAGLTPHDGTMPLDSALSTHFTVSDTLSCLGLFRNGREVSPSDTLFIEDDYTLRFNRPLHPNACRDYLLVNGNSPAFTIMDAEIHVNEFVVPGVSCTLSLEAGMPSADSAFLFRGRTFVLIGDSNRIDPALPALTIQGVCARYEKTDSISVSPLSFEKRIVVTPSMKFGVVTDKGIKCGGGKTSGRIVCFMPGRTDTLNGYCDSTLWCNAPDLPANSNCTLTVKAGYRAGNRQLKKDFTALFCTGKLMFPDECRPMIKPWEGGRPFLLLPGSLAVPLERYGSPRVVTAVRNIPAAEALVPYGSTRFLPHRRHADTLAKPSPDIDWYEYVPLRLAPALSAQGRGCAEALLSANGAPFDTIGRFTVTDLGLQVMRGRLFIAVMVTSITGRTPVAGAKVAFVGNNRAVLAEGVTDTSGVFLVRRHLEPMFVSATVSGDTLVYEADGYSIADTTVHDGIIITERGCYRPGDTLFFKGIVRRLKDRWEPSPADSVVVTIAWGGVKQFTDTLPLSGLGSFSGTVAVPDGVELRSYEIVARPLHAQCLLSDEFNVAEFRSAELMGFVGEGVADKDSVRFPITVKWLHGGAAGGCSLSWQCLIYRFLNNPPSGDVELCNRLKTHICKESAGTALLDSTGKAIVAVSRLSDDSGAVYRLSAAGHGSPVQSTHLRGSVEIPWSHRIRIGISTREKPKTGDTVIRYFKAIRENGEIVRSCTLGIDIVYHTVVKRRATNRCKLPAVVWDTIPSPLRRRYSVTDSLGFAALHMVSPPAGDYTVTVVPPGADQSGSYMYHFTVTAFNRAHRRSEDTSGVETCNDRKDAPGEFAITTIGTGTYGAGDTARVAIKAGRDSCRVIVTVGRENLYDCRWIDMTGRDTVVIFPVRDEYIPAVQILASFLPPLRKNGEGFAFNQPEPVKTASIDLHVSAESRRIPVRVTTDRAAYAPGDSATVRLAVPPGFASATALVMAVDEGVLRLTDEGLPNVHSRFVEKSGTSRRFISESSFQCLHGTFEYDSCNRLRKRPTRGRRGAAGIGYGGGFGSGFGGSGKGGIRDTGGLLIGDGSIRNPPRPCAYFNPRVTFNTDGKAVLRFMLPGNLTRWRVTAIVDDTASFGEDTVSFEANKPLMVRPQLPRFLRVGDSASAVYIVENRSSSNLTVSSSASFHGTTSAETFVLSSGRIRRCRFPLVGRTVGTDSLLFLARGDTLGDGAACALPVIFERPRDMAAIGGSTIDSAAIPVILPKPETIDGGALTLSLSATRMQDCFEGMRYLFDYPYGCLEQRSSAILPLLMAGDFARHCTTPMLSKKDEKEVIRTYLDHIGDFQNRSDGGLGYWPADTGNSSPWLTAFVLEIMIDARKRGFTVNDSVYRGALDYLKRETSRMGSGGRKRFIDSYTVLVLAKAGTPDRPALRRLYKEIKTLPFSARINLLKAMHAAGRFKRKVTVLQKSLLRGLIEKDRLAYVAPEEARGFEFCHESLVRLTALTIEALLETDSRSRFDEPMLRWLSDQRRGGRWRTTQENMAAFRALAAYTGAYEKDEPKLKASIKLAGSDWFVAALEGREEKSVRTSRSLDSIAVHGKTDVSVGLTGSGRLYWDLLLSTFPAGKALPASSGLSITRTIEPVGEVVDSPFDSSRIRIGEPRKVLLTVRCDQDITFVAINDPLPAGCEAVDPDLNTGERDVAAKITRWSGPAALSRREFRDSRVLLFIDNMPAGEYRFSYLLKPTTAGTFLWPAPRVEAMYYPEIFGRGAEETVSIVEGR